MTIQYDNLNSTISAVGSATDIPINIQPKGTGGLNLLGSGQNLLTQSQTFTNSVWSGSSATRADNVTTAPNGTSTAGTFTTVNTTYGGFLRQNITLTTTTYTLSAYVKKNNYRYVGLRFGNVINGNNFAFFDFDTATTNTVGISGATLTATDAGNGWYRLALTCLNPSSVNNLIDISTTASDGSCFTNLGAGQIVYVWGVQFELGSVANTYIPTTTTAIYGTPTLTLSGVAGLGLQSDGSLYVQPAGTGAIQAQPTTSTTAGGNVRGSSATDFQKSRFLASQVASGSSSTIGGGLQSTASGYASIVAGGDTNTASAGYSSVVGGNNNIASGNQSSVVNGISNSATGFYGFVGNGFTNSTTANAAVTTQSATMNGTTAVTLSGSNASIRVGQYITGTSIGSDTYVAAISGTSLTLSKIATGSTTNTISFFTPHGVVVGGGNNQATGSYSFIGGGGDAGTAANRNVASGDWSVVCGGTRHTASGLGSFIGGGGTFAPFGTFPHTASGVCASIVGGFQNTASGQGSFVGSGYLNTANGQFSAIMGGEAGTTRSIVGNHVFPACSEPISIAVGVSQAALLVLAVQTTDATATALRSNASAAGTGNQVILPNNSAYYFRGEIISGVTGGGNTKGWYIEGVIKRGANAASTALVGTPTVTSNYADAGASTWAIAVTADTTNGGLAVTFTGQASTTIRTVAQIRTTEMTY